MSAKAQTASTKRINKVTIKRILDDSPDTSWIGEYSSRPENEFAIDRDHSDDCPRFWANDDIPDDAQECDCSSRDRNTFQYFNPGSVEKFDPLASWIPESIKQLGTGGIREYWLDSMKRNALADYKRMEALNNGGFYFIGMMAEAEVLIPSGTDSRGGTCYTVQHITSGGLWGIESDSDASYLAEIEQEQLSELRDQLHAIGFSRRAIAAAFRNVQKTGGNMTRRFRPRGNEIVSGKPIRIYDDGGSGDHITVVFMNREEYGFTPEYIRQTGRNFYPMLGMSFEPFHPQGICQHTEGQLGPHLGKRITFAELPEPCKQAIMQDLRD